MNGKRDFAYIAPITFNMKSDDALLRMLTNHVLNVTSLIDDVHIFFMVRYKEDVANRRRFWFARGNLRKDFLLHGLKSNGASDDEIDGTDASRPKDSSQSRQSTESRPQSHRHPVLQPAQICDPGDMAGKNDDDDDDDHCPVRKGVGGPTMNRIAKDDEDDDDDEKSGSGMGISCTGVEDVIGS